MRSPLTPAAIRRLLESHAEEILLQLGPSNVRLGMGLNDPEPCLRVSVRAERVDAMPRSVHVTTDQGRIDIPLKVTGDYEPAELQ